MCEYSACRDVSFLLNYRFPCEQIYNMGHIPGWARKESGLVSVLKQSRLLSVSNWAKILKSFPLLEFLGTKQKDLRGLHSSWYLLSFTESQWTSPTQRKGSTIMMFAGQRKHCEWRNHAWQLQPLRSFELHLSGWKTLTFTFPENCIKHVHF